MSVILRDIDKDNVSGYLGNKLFILAAAYTLAHKNKVDLLVPPFEFQDIFKKPFFKIISEYGSSINENDIEDYNEPNFEYNEIKYQPNISLHGYFQSYHYFTPSMKKTLKLRDDIIDDAIHKVNNQLHETYETILAYNRICSIHCRFSDYLSLESHYVNLSKTDYYQRSMAIMDEKTDYFLVFSNDIPLAKTLFKGKKFIYCESEQEKPLGNKSAVEDLYLQSLCDDHITANSSFSWWSSWLGDSLNKRVIAPSNWFGPALKHYSTDDLIPKTWIQM